MSWRYDSTTTTSSSTTAAATHGANARNASPPVSRIISISCGAYATELSASDAKIGSAIRFGSRCSSAFSDASGSPIRMRFTAGASGVVSRFSLVTAGDTTPKGHPLQRDAAEALCAGGAAPLRASARGRAGGAADHELERERSRFRAAMLLEGGEDRRGRAPSLPCRELVDGGELEEPAQLVAVHAHHRQIR